VADRVYNAWIQQYHESQQFKENKLPLDLEQKFDQFPDQHAFPLWKRFEDNHVKCFVKQTDWDLAEKIARASQSRFSKQDAKQDATTQESVPPIDEGTFLSLNALGTVDLTGEVSEGEIAESSPIQPSKGRQKLPLPVDLKSPDDP
jgi:hypothetical protein